MASSDYDRPPVEGPVDSTAPPAIGRTSWSGPVGIVLAILFIALLLMALLG